MKRASRSPAGRSRVRKAPAAGRRATGRRVRVDPVDARELDAVRAQLESLARHAGPPRWNADPEDVRRSVAKLVLTLVEFIRQLLERQAIRRMESGTMTEEETEAVGLALMKLEDAVREIGAQFGLEPGDLNLDLGPLGRMV